MENKIKIILAVIVIIIIVIASLNFFLLKEEIDPLGNLEYVDAEENFGLNPPEGWIVKDRKNDESVIYMSIYYPPNNITNFIQIDISVTHINSNMDFDGQVNNFLDNYFTRFTPENFSRFSHGNTTVNEMEAYEFKYMLNYSENLSCKIKLILLENKKRFFLIEYKGTIDLFETYESILDKSINSLIIA